MSDMIYLVARTPGTNAEARCALCGNARPQERIPAMLVDDFDLSIGDVCDECVNGGAEGAARRARDHAKDLLEHARGLFGLADMIAAMPDWGRLMPDQAQCVAIGGPAPLDEAQLPARPTRLSHLV